LYEENLNAKTLQKHEDKFELIITRMKQLEQLPNLFEIQKNNSKNLAVPYYLNEEEYKS
jgi:hypothetical protein